jgi:hypothetical protein
MNLLCRHLSKSSSVSYTFSQTSLRFLSKVTCPLRLQHYDNWPDRLLVGFLLALFISLILIPYYFEYKTSSTLRRIQILNVDFRRKVRKVHAPRIQNAPQYFMGKMCKMCVLYSKQYGIYFKHLSHSILRILTVRLLVFISSFTILFRYLSNKSSHNFCNYNFNIGVDSASNRNEYQESSKKKPGGKVRPARRADNLAAIC